MTVIFQTGLKKISPTLSIGIHRVNISFSIMMVDGLAFPLKIFDNIFLLIPDASDRSEVLSSPCSTMIFFNSMIFVLYFRALSIPVTSFGAGMPSGKSSNLISFVFLTSFKIY